MNKYASSKMEEFVFIPHRTLISFGEDGKLDKHTIPEVKRKRPVYRLIVHQPRSKRIFK